MIMLENNLQGKLVLITGASSGIGFATAKAFAMRGARLLLCARRITNLSLLKDEILSDFPNAEVRIFELDVRQQSEVENKLNSFSDISEVEILVNNAGLSRGLDKIQDGLISDWEEMLDTNVKGLLYVSRVMLPHMIKQGSGHLINIGSIAGREVYPKGNVYCASKFAVSAITQGMRIDLNGTGVKITTIDPGLVETEFSLVRFHGDKEKAKIPYNGITPLHAKDIADAIVYAASREKHVVINEMVIMPLAQATATIVDRKL